MDHLTGIANPALEDGTRNEQGWHARYTALLAYGSLLSALGRLFITNRDEYEHGQRADDTRRNEQSRRDGDVLEPKISTLRLFLHTNFPMSQFDTGSSDLWLVSTSCSTSSCNAVGGHKYDPSQSLPTGQITTLHYAEGQVDGPIVWDAVQFAGYGIDHQALIAASNVNDEPLNGNFNGVLGLGLPLNSVVAQKIPPTMSDAPAPTKSPPPSASAATPPPSCPTPPKYTAPRRPAVLEHGHQRPAVRHSRLGRAAHHRVPRDRVWHIRRDGHRPRLGRQLYGSFPDNTGAASRIQPRLGILPLTDPATAAQEFYQVRVLKQPLSNGSGGATSGGAAQGSGNKGLSTGIEVFLGLLGFFGLCFVLFGARFAYMKRRWARGAPLAAAAGGPTGGAKDGSYGLTEREREKSTFGHACWSSTNLLTK
ncbi:hypothetical protein C8Q78DRAFT_1078123 [Trametes maxima]|nr:hypothetical protein C8Q78DRAFT_1078123 [Trametes maxima]